MNQSTGLKFINTPCTYIAYDIVYLYLDSSSNLLFWIYLPLYFYSWCWIYRYIFPSGTHCV